MYSMSPTPLIEKKAKASFVKNFSSWIRGLAGLTTVRAWARIPVTVGYSCEYELLTYILAFTAPETRSKTSVNLDSQVPK